MERKKKKNEKTIKRRREHGRVGVALGCFGYMLFAKK